LLLGALIAAARDLITLPLGQLAQSILNFGSEARSRCLPEPSMLRSLTFRLLPRVCLPSRTGQRPTSSVRLGPRSSSRALLSALLAK